MAFSEAQIKLLSSKLNGKHVKIREQRGAQLSYIEGWHAIDQANRIFGFDGWDREMMWSECVWQDVRREPKACAYAARVRIRVRAGDVVISRDGSGVGHGTGATLGEAHESALKEAETDATKRALTTFGNLFGLALYDKQQSGVRWSKRVTAIKNEAEQWRLFSPEGQVLSTHADPGEFCAALRDALAATRSLEEVDALWSSNARTVELLRSVAPELRTARGTHYVDVLRRCYEGQKSQFGGPGAERELRPSEGASIDKSALSLAVPKRIRDIEHLEFVASLPCLICGRTPTQAHHLRFAQPRALSSKPSDEWTVPLCLLHHRALHDAGSEERWWEEQRLNPRAEAERLWQESRESRVRGSEVEAALIDEGQPIIAIEPGN